LHLRGLQKCIRGGFQPRRHLVEPQIILLLIFASTAFSGDVTPRLDRIVSLMCCSISSPCISDS
jgi:hypothetical protein